MAEQDLYDANIDPLFQEMGGVAMSEGMGPGFGMDFGLFYGFFEDLVESRIMHRHGGNRLFHAPSSR